MQGHISKLTLSKSLFGSYLQLNEIPLVFTVHLLIKQYYLCGGYTSSSNFFQHLQHLFQLKVYLIGHLMTGMYKLIA